MKEEREDGQVDVVPLEDHVLARRSFLKLRLLGFYLALTELRNLMTITASRHAAPLPPMVLRGIVEIEYT